MKKNLLLLGIIILLMACHKKSGDDPQPPAVPGKATLTFPLQNALCTSGTAVSATQSTIVFTWAVSTNTDSYQIYIKNLLNGGIIIQTATTNQASVQLARGTPYSWYVVSKSTASTTTTISDTFKFYNAGLGVTAYAPFPAAITSPTFNQSITATGGTINLTWAGSDVDNDIAGYDIYLGTNASPAIFKTNVTDMFLNNVAVTSGATYYLKIITKDLQGNTSDSGVIQFAVK